MGPYSTYNLGDIVLLIGILKTIEKIYKKNVKLLTFSSTKKFLLKYLKEVNLSKNIELQIISNKIIFLFYFLFSKCLVIGGGSLLVKKRNPWKYILLLLLSKLSRKKTMLLSVDTDCIDSKFKLIVRLSEQVVVRNKFTYQICKKYYKKTHNLFLLPDIGCIYFQELLKKFRKLKPKRKKIFIVPAIYKYYKENVRYNNVEILFQEVKTPTMTLENYFKRFYLYAKVCFSFHYHTLLFCRLADIKTISLQKPNPKHNSIYEFKKKEYTKCLHNYCKILEKFLSKL